jgi:phosphoribosylformimino-5-aminoimidazole carboxamide ribotide isomerase
MLEERATTWLTGGFTIYPAIDVSAGRCVGRTQGRAGSESIYAPDPTDVAMRFAAAGARCIHVVDLDAASEAARGNKELILELVSRTPCAVQVGGGLRDLHEIGEFLMAGARRVVVGTMAVEDERGLRRACKRFTGRVAVALDASSGTLVTHGWVASSVVSVGEGARALADAGVAAFIYTDVARDGTLSGADLSGAVRIAGLTDVPVVVSGGVASLEDVCTIAGAYREGVRGVIVGRALHRGRLDLGEAQRSADHVVERVRRTRENGTG